MRPRQINADDVLWPVVTFVIGAVLIALGDGTFAGLPSLATLPNPWWQLIPLALVTAAGIVQRHAPFAAFAVATAVVAASVLVDAHIAVLVAWTHAIYGMGRYAKAADRRRALVILAVFGLAWASWSWSATDAPAAGVTVLLQVAVVALIPLWWGSEVRSGDERAEVERVRADASTRLAEIERAEAVRTERERMARDLHDTVSSHLSTIAIYTTGALDLEPDSSRDRKVLGEVRGSALAALADMRDLIELLRDQPTSAEPPPLDETLAELRAAGLDIESDVADFDMDGRGTRTLALVAREALTNALKHGTGTARFEIAKADGDVRMTITNPVAAESRRLVSDGIGLGSMAKRVREAGGSFASGETVLDGERVWRTTVEMEAR